MSMAAGSTIIGSGHYVPETVVTNQELAEVIDTNDQWIVEHTGIRQRHISLAGQNTSDLATAAAQIALEKANLKAEQIDLILVSTITPDYLTPATAAIVQENIQASNAFAYDISTACAGFVFALSTADKFIRYGQYQNALVISSEVNSKMMDFKDRTSTVFFGDGAGAVVLSSGQTSQLKAEDLHTKGNHQTIHSGQVAPLKAISADNFPQLDAFYQDGPAVFEFATNEIPDHIQSFLALQDLTANQIDYFILHQANLRIIETIAEKLNQPIEKFPYNLDLYGNTSSAGIAMAFDQLFSQQNLTGEKIVLTGFGAGLSYGSILLEF